MYSAYLATPANFPLPFIHLQATDQGISGLDFCQQATEQQASHPLIEQCKAELTDYFQQGRQQFTVPLDLVGTHFQKAVWQALLTIPFGQTCSYQAIAWQIAKPNAQRAVGAANGRNPVSLIVPCHRVIGSNGKLVGYGGGLPIKQWLLNHEKQFIQ